MAMLDFASNSNSIKNQASLISLLKKNAHRVIEYPDNENEAVLSSIKKYLGIPSANIALGIGSTQLLFNIPNLLSYKRALIPVPTFWEYTTFNSIWKRKIKKIHLSEKHDFAPDYKLLDSEIKDEDCVFFANVNNPTSLIYKRSELLKLIDRHPKASFVVDETYLIFRNDYRKESLIKEAQRRKNLIVVTSCSKFFGLAGVRIGFMVADKETIARYNQRFHIPYSIGIFTEIALIHQLEHTTHLAQTRNTYVEERLLIYNLIKKQFVGRLYPIRPDGNFILCRIETKQESEELQQKLGKMGMGIRGGHELLDISNKWIRFSLRSKKDNQMLMRALDLVLK